MNKPLEEIFPQLAGLGEEAQFSPPLEYGPLVANMAHEVLAFAEDPNPPGGEEGHRYWLLGGGPESGQNFGVLIMARYFDDDPGLQMCDYVFDAREVAEHIEGKVQWCATMAEALTRIRRRLSRQHSGHGDASKAFLAAVEAIPAPKILEILNRKWA